MGQSRILAGIVLAVLPILMMSGAVEAFAPAGEVADAVWARTDRPVAEGVADRTWMWGPEANTPALSEPYRESPGGARAVQYFDKSRMEITDPEADPGSVWYITNGLLVVELVSGRMQVGHGTFEERSPARVNVAGDADGGLGPTYETFGRVLEQPPHTPGSTITATLERGGEIGENRDLAEHGVTAAELVPETDHTVASVFWDFMNSRGVVYEDGGFTEDRLFENPYFATGYPVSEAYWSRVSVAGTVKWVLVQAFERRVLTYTPDNPPGWQVESGNVGQHYYIWRYERDEEPEPPPVGEDEPELVVAIQGVEVSAGTRSGDTTFGVRFVGRTGGDLAGFFAASINYTPPRPGPGVTNTITGGEWSIETQDGRIAGRITDGQAVWDNSVSEAAITATFLVADDPDADAGTGAYAGVTGEGTFAGTLSHRSFPPTLDGELTLTLTPP